MLQALTCLLRQGESVTADDLEQIAADHETRILLWRGLQRLNRESLMPAEWAKPEMLAGSNLANWLSSPSELNALPEHVELMKRFLVDVDGEVLEAYLFRFREFAKPWEPGEGWMAGIAGPIQDGESTGSPWSSFKRWDSMSDEEHFDKLFKG